MVELFAKSEDSDQTPHSAASDLGLHCLPITLLGVSRLQWVIMPKKPPSENVVCLCRLLNILANFSKLFLHKGKQCGPWSECSSDLCTHWLQKWLLKITKQTTVVVIGSLRVHKVLNKSLTGPYSHKTQNTLYFAVLWNRHWYRQEYMKDPFSLN